MVQFNPQGARVRKAECGGARFSHGQGGRDGQILSTPGRGRGVLWPTSLVYSESSTVGDPFFQKLMAGWCTFNPSTKETVTGESL